MAVWIVCDRSGCPSRRVEDAADLSGWLVLHGLDEDAAPTRHFCSEDCMVRHVTAFEVPETIPHD